MENEKISIIMGIYNCERYLEDSINSILEQTYKNWELIMCDDGSIDSTYNIAKKFEEKYPDKIILLKNESNRGLNYTLNKCFKKATGEYVARQDGDDVSIPSRFEKEINFITKHKEYAFVSSNMILFDEKGDWGKTNNKEVPSKIDFVKGSPFCHAPCLIKREIFDEVEGYTVDKKLLRVEDYHLWFKIYSKGYIGYNIQETLYKARDDRDAYKRRNYRNRINEARVKFIGFRMLNIPIRYYIYILRPLLIGLLPMKIYDILHKNRLKIN